MMHYVKGQGWVYGPETKGIPASALQVGDRIIKAWDNYGEPANWHSFPYVLAEEESYNPRTYKHSWWVKRYGEIGYTFEVTRDV